MRQREAFAAVDWAGGQTELGGHRQAQGGPGLGGQATADDQGNTATGAHFVKQHIAFELELGDDLAVFERLAVVRAQLDHVAHGHLAHVQLDRQRAGIFHGVVENRGDLGAQADATEAFVRHKRNVLPSEPEHRVGGRLAG